MRNLCLALLLANFAFAAYHNWIAPDAATVGATASRAPSLVLADELELAANPPTAMAEAEASPAATSRPAVGGDVPAAEADFAGPSTDTAAATVAEEGGSRPAVRAPDSPDLEPPATGGIAAAITPASSCVSVGPFRELSQAATAAANLRASGLDPSQRAGEGEIWVGYWVYIERIPGVAAAEAILAELKEKGVTDSYVIPRSDSGTLISLGVFTEIGRASNRRGAVRELGYEATISDRTRRATVYWIDVVLGDGELLDFEQLQPPGRIVRLEQRPCPQTPA